MVTKAEILDDIEMMLREYGLAGSDAQVSDIYVEAEWYVSGERKHLKRYVHIGRRTAYEHAIQAIRELHGSK